MVQKPFGNHLPFRIYRYYVAVGDRRGSAALQPGYTADTAEYPAVSGRRGENPDMKRVML